MADDAPWAESMYVVKVDMYFGGQESSRPWQSEHEMDRPEVDKVENQAMNRCEKYTDWPVLATAY